MSAPFSKKITKIQKIIIVLTIFLSGFWLLTSQILAQTKQLSLTAIPPRLGDTFELRAAPGEVIQATVRVRNTSSEPISIETAFEDFILDTDGSTPIPLNEEVSGRWSMNDWVTVSPKNQIVPAHQSVVANVVINVPTDALAGGHYGMVLHQPSNNVTAETSQSSINQRVGTLLYLMVEGDISEEAFIRDLAFPQFTEYGPVPFSFTVENVSDIHIHPQIGVEIYNLFGQKVDTISVETKNVFPFTPRTFDSQWERTWGIGRYKAKVIMSYGQEGKVVLAQTFFWLLPIKIVLAVFISLLSLLAIFIAVRRHIVHRQDYKQQKIEMLERKIQELQTDPTQDPNNPQPPTEK